MESFPGRNNNCSLIWAPPHELGSGTECGSSGDFALSVLCKKKVGWS